MGHPDMGKAAVPVPRATAPPEFDQFFRSHYKKLIAVALAQGATWHEAEESVDQTMEEVLRRWGDLRQPDRYAARAVVSNFVKKRTRDREAVPRAIQGGYLDREGEPDSRLSDWEDRQWIEQMLDRLPETQRAVAELILVAQASYAEAAVILDKNEATVRKNLQLARRRLRELVEQERHPEPAPGPQRRSTTSEKIDGRKPDDQ
ncbi:RNA polymerase sigma factor [Actinomadura fibrosa]|uniref:RNA polymerase sigma factor n=1 Tax=Actinomadura fibrosa TaxID=111802 RepID=A0ABW2XNA6_9ACTN|nr:sigma-70 family RNA polymerase sigma factor [Actinomadura fibrosa]